jgi:hypothetical protein
MKNKKIHRKYKRKEKGNHRSKDRKTKKEL